MTFIGGDKASKLFGSKYKRLEFCTWLIYKMEKESVFNIKDSQTAAQFEKMIKHPYQLPFGNEIADKLSRIDKVNERDREMYKIYVKLLDFPRLCKIRVYFNKL